MYEHKYIDFSISLKFLVFLAEAGDRNLKCNTKIQGVTAKTAHLYYIGSYAVEVHSSLLHPVRMFTFYEILTGN